MCGRNVAINIKVTIVRQSTMINIFHDMILCSSCFSANFALICPNGIGFVMDRHGVSGEITGDHPCLESMLVFWPQISFGDTVCPPGVCLSNGTCPIWTGEQGSMAKYLRENKNKFEDHALMHGLWANSPFGLRPHGSLTQSPFKLEE